MIIRVNGDEYTSDKTDTTLLDILRERKVRSPETVTVQLNGRFIKHEDLGRTVPQQGDEVEFLFLMAGGA